MPIIQLMTGSCLAAKQPSACRLHRRISRTKQIHSELELSRPVSQSTHDTRIISEAVQVHEQFHRGELGDLAAEVKALPLKGEVTVVVEGATSTESTSAVDIAAIQEHLEELIGAGVQPSQAARLVSKLLNLPKGQLYDMAVRIAAQAG